MPAGLDEAPREEGLTRAPEADDQSALDLAAREADVMRFAQGAERVALLWDVAQVPDYRKIAPANHADLVTTPLPMYGMVIVLGRHLLQIIGQPPDRQRIRRQHHRLRQQQLFDRRQHFVVGEFLSAPGNQDRIQQRGQ